MGLFRTFSCLVGCLPGIIVGSTYTLLIVTLWRLPAAIHYNREEIIVGTEPRQSNDLYQATLDSSRFLKRHDHTFDYLEASGKENCEKALLDFSAGDKEVEHTLLVLAHSSPDSRQERDSIRETWLSANRRQRLYTARFVVGLANLSSQQLNDLACENKKFGDMVLFHDLNDTKKEYSSSEKLLFSFIWAEENVRYKYIFKVTDRTFAILEVILNDLRKRENNKDFVWGFFAGGVEVTHEDHLKESDWFLCSHYLPHPQGGGYVISKSIVSMLRTMAPVLQHYAHDDIALGVWLSPFKGVEYFHDVRFNTGHYSRGCSNAYIVTHMETSVSMRTKFAAMREGGHLCEIEQVFRPSYQYNWTVPADRCCLRKPGIP